MHTTYKSLLGAIAVWTTGTSVAFAHPGHETVPTLLHALTSFSHAGPLLIVGAAIALVLIRRKRTGRRDQSS